MEDTPTSFTASAAQGSVEMQGYAWPAQSLTAPMTNEQACFYLVVGRIWNDDTYKDVFKTTSENSFFLADAAGTVLIQPDTEMTFTLDNTTSGKWHELNILHQDQLIKILNKKNIYPQQLDQKNLYIEVYYLKPQSHLYVNGSLRPLIENEKSITPAAGLEQFMIENRRKFVRNYIVNDKVIDDKDSPWAKKSDGKSATELVTSNFEHVWQGCYGTVCGHPDKPLLLFDQWKTQAKEGLESYTVAIIGGAIMFTISLLPFLFSVVYK